MNWSSVLGSVLRGIRSRSREIALVVILLLINYLIFSRLGIMILSGRQPTPTATRTPKPTFTPSEFVAATPTLPPESAPTAEPTPVSSPAPITHVVQSGETLSEIARMYGVTVEAVVEANNLDNPNAVREGQVLLIPSSTAPAPTGEATRQPVPTPSSSVGQRIHVVQEGETLTEIADAYGVTVEEIVQANGLDNPNAISVGQALVIP